MQAKIVENQVSVKMHGTLPNGVKFLILDLYGDYLQMPMALEFEGVQYGRTGWNSESHQVYYRDDKKTATVLK